MEFRNRTDAVDLQQTRAATCDVDDTLARSTHFLGYFLIFTSTSRDLSTESNLLCAVSLPIDSLDPMWLPEVRTHASRMTRHQLQSTAANPSKNVNGNNHNTIRTNTHKHNPAARQFCSPSPVGCRYDYYYLSTKRSYPAYETLLFASTLKSRQGMYLGASILLLSDASSIFELV